MGDADWFPDAADLFCGHRRVWADLAKIGGAGQSSGLRFNRESVPEIHGHFCPRVSHGSFVPEGLFELMGHSPAINGWAIFSGGDNNWGLVELVPPGGMNGWLMF